jgi:ATP-dependent protease ClpP protease subunit
VSKVIKIDGLIGTKPNEISASYITSQLPENGTEPIEIEIHSEGGSVIEGFAAYDAIAAYQGRLRFQLLRSSRWLGMKSRSRQTAT